MYLESLKRDVWEKVKGNKLIAKGNHYYEDIKHAIYQQTGILLNKDTIRNFFEGRNQPSPRSLDIYATFVLDGDQKNMKTILDYQANLKEHSLTAPNVLSYNEVTITDYHYKEVAYLIRT